MILRYARTTSTPEREAVRLIEKQNRCQIDPTAENEKVFTTMWFIFPQIDGLGHSFTNKCFAIKSIEEARQYLYHPVLGKRLKECAKAVLAIESRPISIFFGYSDDLKLKSSLPLFESVANSDSIFTYSFNKYFHKERDVTCSKY